MDKNIVVTPMEPQDVKEKLHVILCGPLRWTEEALLQRGDVEIKRDEENLNLLAQMLHGTYDCDMIIVEAPYGQGLYCLRCPVRDGKDCPAWMVDDPPDAVVWKEINLQLDAAFHKISITT